MRKVPKVFIDVLEAYKKIENQPIVGKTLTQIAESLNLNYTNIYVMSVTAKLKGNGFLERDIDDDGIVTYTVTEDGNEMLRSAGIEISDDEPAEEPKVEIPEIKKQTSSFKFDEADKEKAILSLLNDTLLKTVVYCKDLSDQLGTVEREKKILDIEEELKNTKAELNRQEMLVNSYRKDKELLQEQVPGQVTFLKCNIDSKIDEYYEMIPWQRELAKDQFKKELLTMVDELMQDLSNLIEPSDNDNY